MEQLSRELQEFLEKIVKSELKWMYHYDVDSEVFGVETDRYSWCKRVLDGNISIHSLLDYFTRQYPNDEKDFISHIKEIM
jgi:hypothetical protein